ALGCREAWCRVSLRRIGAGGRVLAAAPLFEISARPEDVLELAGAVRVHLGRLYPGHPPRAGAPPLDVRPEDYAAYLGLRRREVTGERLGREDLARLEEVLEGSPAFLEGRLLAANLARVLREPDRARRHAEAGARLDPRDIRALAVLARLELDTATLEDAEAAVARLEAAAPGAPASRAARARLLSRLDRRPEAVEAWRDVVARRPSWTHLYWLAREEVAAGFPADARAHLEELLQRSPGNEFGLALLAGLEARSGSLERAEAAYRELIARDPQALYHTNLGWVRFLLGRYEEAVGSYRQALILAPGDLHTRFNLAVAEAAAGRPERAREDFRELIEELEAAEGTSPSANDLLIRAQCLARLGRAGEAVALTDRTLRDHPEEAQLRYQAALVYALVGERYSALHNARAALEGGLSGAWFAIPAFDRLQTDPELQALLALGGEALKR
ncbi:MAG TPA: tetratricopeptide repeat protein, partial [Thermoanaerobaculia bacterium]|nr:tetratricopeptide repeat protein [Thermoanaerobaculia bacterium]